jgi:hypothetical protein
MMGSYKGSYVGDDEGSFPLTFGDYVWVQEIRQMSQSCFLNPICTHTYIVDEIRMIMAIDENGDLLLETGKVVDRELFRAHNKLIDDYEFYAAWNGTDSLAPLVFDQQ